MRGPSRSSSSEAALGGSPEEKGSPGIAFPRARTQSHEEAAGGGSPTSPRFRDPLLLLGLAAGGGDPDFFPHPPWSPLLAHYDVQSILFDPAEPPTADPGPTSGASAAHLEPEEPPGPHGAPPDPEALVLSCPRFCCETGGEQEPGLGPPRVPPGPGQLPNAAVAVLEEPPAGARPPHPIEHSDDGAEYYRKYFYGKEHQNLLGEDPRLGPVAVSLRREEKEGPRAQVLHRIILRTCQPRTLRGSVLEEALPPGSRPSGARGVPPRKLLELVLPGLVVGGLRLAPSPAVQETLLKLDEQGVSRQRKVGVLYCRGGQGSEEEMYNNEEPGPAFEQFLALLGTRVRLRGFAGYRAQLDTRTDSTGTHSLYTTYHGYEVMFHVSTMLPFTPRNPQQLLRKRHIGNDIVTIVFQEPGARPFSPRALRSHFQHIFIVVRVHEPCTPHTTYSVAVVRPEETPPFGPALAAGQRFLGGAGLRPFLLAKAINGENAAARGGRLGAMAARTRRQYLQELLRAHGGGAPLPAPPRGLPALGGRRRGSAGRAGGAAVAGALVWGARAQGGPGGAEVPCLLGVAAERVVVVAAPPGAVTNRSGGLALNPGNPPPGDRPSAGEGRLPHSKGNPHVTRGWPRPPQGTPPPTREQSPSPPGVLFSCACRDVLGWGFAEGRLEIFYGAGEWLGLRLPHGAAPQVVARLQAVTRGCEARELALPRGAGGRRGFRVDPSGVVTAVTRFSFAETAGLRPGTRLLRVGHRPLPRGDPRLLRALLRRPSGPLTLLPPDRDGRPRRSFLELYARSLEQGRGTGGDPGGDLGGDIGDTSSDSGGDSDRGDHGVGPGGLHPDTLQLLRSLALDEESTPFPPGGGPPSPGTLKSPTGCPPQPVSYAGHGKPPKSSGIPQYPWNAPPKSLGPPPNPPGIPCPPMNPSNPHSYDPPGLPWLTPRLTCCCRTTAPPSPVTRLPVPLLPPPVLRVPLWMLVVLRPPPSPAPPPGLSLRHSLGRLLSGSGEPQEEEWELIARLATACSGVLEAIARGGHQLREPPNIEVQQSLSPVAPEDESRSLSEKVAQLEAALKRLQEGLQEDSGTAAAPWHGGTCTWHGQVGTVTPGTLTWALTMNTLHTCCAHSHPGHTRCGHTHCGHTHCGHTRCGHTPTLGTLACAH
ncbi:LOW QUALITY PROTEIN: signal-induced proliferation-associated protein 1-like [Neopelma chrysocephalum]|uniref:LOW QUALITY PROTEIN: signal-induced proliferation-associated protein 1-like n=1 Tax=Neopelma chrysocephalum TaxID=114329 RepID=UPI000FCD2704|nr:LOW QUALITY PROTEIN: signal-induced proliferation-associated protein 1-like [Neopelma chrysocephalum]